MLEKLSLTGQSKHAVDDQMKGLSALFVDGEAIFIDNGAIHAKSRLERNIQFVKRADEVPNGRLIYGMWLTLHRFKSGQGYYGAAVFTLTIDDTLQIGYKDLSNHVNQMDHAVRGRIMLDPLPHELRDKIGGFLKAARLDLWQNAQPAFLTAFESTDLHDK